MRIFRQIALLGIAFFATLFIAELLIRATHLGSVSSTEFYEDIGRGRRRNLNYLYFNEGFGIGNFNEYRYIGESHSPRKEEGTVRIVLLGDSYVESFQVFDRHYFGNIAEKYLSDRFPGTKIEILNFGRSGFDIGNMYAYHSNFITKFNPDYVLYMLSEADLDPQITDSLRPRTVMENDSLKIFLDFSESEIKRFNKAKIYTQHSCVINMLNNCRKRALETPAASIFLGKVYDWLNPHEDIVISKEVSELSYELNQVTKSIIQNLDPFDVLFINRDDQKLPDDFEIYCYTFGFKYFDLSETINQMKAQNIDPNEWIVTNKSGHWNIQAHEHIGTAIGNWLADIIENQHDEELE